MSWPIATANTSAHQAIEARIKDQWKLSGVQRTAIQWPSVLGLVNTDGSILTEPPATTPWLKVDIINGDTEPATFGGPTGLNLNQAIIQLAVFVPRNKGQKTANELAGIAKAVFSRYQLSGLRCWSSSVRDAEEQGWLVKIVRTPVEYYEEVT